MTDSSSNADTLLTITQPDDWHVHLREGEALATTVKHTAAQFGRACVMPNLTDPVISPAQAHHYWQQIQNHIPHGSSFTPLLSLYLTEHTDIDWVAEVRAQPHLLAFKYYPAGATTHSAAGVNSALAIYPILAAMEKNQVPLQIHGEVTDPSIDIFDREAVFIERVLQPITQQFPALRIVLEHITTQHAVDFIREHAGPVAATITAHHLMLNRNDLLVGGIKPHHYCLPILKHRRHQQALLAAATSGNPRFFLGTDSAPHSQTAKESACGCAGIYTANAALEWYATVFAAQQQLPKLNHFASVYGAQFYQLPVNTRSITVQPQPWRIPEAYPLGAARCIPLRAGQICPWKCTSV